MVRSRMSDVSLILIFHTLVLLPLVLRAQVHAAPDCYFRRAGNIVLLGNSKIEITVQADDGAIKQIRNKSASQTYLLPDAVGNFRLVYSGVEANSATSGDLWTAVSGTLIDGTKQHASALRSEKVTGGIRLDISYDTIRLEKRAVKIGVRYSITLSDRSEATSWTISIENHDTGTVREAQFPFLVGLTKFDKLIMPNHSGQLLRDPVERLSDEIPNVHLEYPARASMQWFEYFSHRAGLYVAAYDKELSYKQFFWGRTEARDKRTAMWVVHYPFAATSSTWQSPELELGFHAGDWHWGGDRYRNWYRSWVPRPQVSKYVREMVDSDVDIFIKDMDEKLLHSYSDAARIALERPHSAASMLVGWHMNGHDTYYPDYVPIPDLGGKEALLAAIDAIHSGGQRVSAYTNVRLSAIASRTYKEGGSAWAVLSKTPGTGVPSLSDSELREDWNTVWSEAKKGVGSHAVMCPSAKGWQDHMVAEVSRVVGEYHFDGVFLDQAGSFYSELCWNKNHGHSTPANAWGPGYLTMLRQIREATRVLNPDSYLWIEGMNDVYGQFIDFQMDKNPVWEPMRTHPKAETFPEMWRYALPEQIMINDPGQYSYPPSKDPAYGDSYFFVMGIRGYGMLSDLPNSAPEERKIRKSVTDKIAQLWAEGKDYFFDGEFLDNSGLNVASTDVLAKVYRGASGDTAVAVWNTSPTKLNANVAVNLQLLNIPADQKLAITSLATGKPFSYSVEPPLLKIKVGLDAHDIDAVLIEKAR